MGKTNIERFTLGDEIPKTPVAEDQELLEGTAWRGSERVTVEPPEEDFLKMDAKFRVPSGKIPKTQGNTAQIHELGKRIRAQKSATPVDVPFDGNAPVHLNESPLVSPTKDPIVSPTEKPSFWGSLKRRFGSR